MVDYGRQRQTLWISRLTDDQLRKRVRSGIARARSHGFTWESSLAQFVGLMIRYAPNSDEFPAMRSLLERRFVPSEERSDPLFEISPELWEEASGRYDSATWDDFG